MQARGLHLSIYNEQDYEACAPEAARGTLRVGAYSSYSVPSRTTVPSLPRGTMAALTDEGAPRLGKPKRGSRGGAASGSV